jgi:hypothetical protein
MRLPFIPPAQLSPEQKLLYDDMKAGIAAKYSTFKTTRPDGAIPGHGAPGCMIPILVTRSGAPQKE